MARGKSNRGGRGGGGGRGRRGGRGGGGGGGGGRQYQDNRQSFDQVKKSNEKMERYYNTLDLVPQGPDREKFWEALRTELPNSFRFTGSKAHALSVRDNLKERYFPQIEKIVHEGNLVELPYPIKWYPLELAYAMRTPKNVIRKYEPFKEFQKFLVSETGVGNISRQEQVSMIPPLVLEVKPEHTVLDLCAAPGSKSAQLIEAIHAGEEEKVARAIKASKEQGIEAPDNTEDQGRSTGLLVANDVNYQRAQMLVHQVKRLNSPNLIVMNHDATQFPSIQLPSEPGKKGRYLKFDRILADVPCSGDGTCRKNPGIWKDWSPQNGLGLYITQVRILTRALQMLKVGGRVVYSTCSMNPVEDEAVVSSAIERCGGVAKVKLIDCSDQLPGLIRSQGLTDWSIMSRTGQIYESWPEAQSNEPEGSKVVPGMFAPDAAEQIPLKNCMRVYPHQQDTGGFFIAALEKLSEIKAKPENESKSGNKAWSFSEPRGKAENTAFGEIMADVRSDAVDGNAHLFKTDSDVTAIDDNVSSAARQSETHDTSLKRKPENEDDSVENGLKKPRLDEEPANLTTTTSDNLDHVHARSQPDIATASGSNGNKSNGLVDGAVKDPANNAPFEQGTVPTSALQAIQNKRGKRGDGSANEEAFKYLPVSHPELEGIYAFYELHPSFPRDRFLVRNPAGDPVKGIYYSSQLVKDILTVNAEGKGLKFVHAGVKMFMKQDTQGQDICPWRIQTEGLPIIEGWVGESRIVRLLKKSTLKKLLREQFIKIGSREEPDEAALASLGEVGEQVTDVGMGCCVLRVETSEGEDGFKELITLAMWKSLKALNVMLPKEDRKAMLLRIYNEDIELINHSNPTQQRNNEANGAGKQAAANGSIPAEDDAKELQQKIAQADDSAVVSKKEGAAFAAQQDSDLEAELLDGSARALEEDAVAAKDRIEARNLEQTENEDTKVTAAMPERGGEGDDYNTTV